MIPKIEASSTRQTTGQKVVDLKPKEAVLPYGRMSLKDINWVRLQPPCVQQLCWDCLAVEQYGKQLRKLETELNEKFFRRAKAALEKQGIFRFEPITELSPAGRLRITGWKVENLHGYYYKSYWEVSPVEQNDSSGQIVSLKETNCQPQGDKLSASRRQIVSTSSLKPLLHKDEKILNQGSTTPQLPTKVVEGRVSTPSEETEAPFGGVLPTGDGLPEEESPTATDDETEITSDATEEVSAEFSTSSPAPTNEVSGEPTDSLEDHSSAAAPKTAKMPLKPSTWSDNEKQAYMNQQRLLAVKWKQEEEALEGELPEKEVMRQIARAELENLFSITTGSASVQIHDPWLE